MLSVYICEDNLLHLNLYKTMIENLIIMEEYDMTLRAAVSDPDELLFLAKQERTRFCNSGFYLLDIELNSHMNGLELAQRIREFDSRGFIVFLTAHSELALSPYKYHLEIMDFIPKEKPWHIGLRLRMCMDTASQRYYKQAPSPIVTFKTGCRTICIEEHAILLIASSFTPHKILVTDHNGVREFYGTLKSCSELLSSDFVRCHKAFIVNIRHIATINHTTMTITLTNGDSCMVSSRGLRQVLNAIHDSGSSVAK